MNTPVPCWMYSGLIGVGSSFFFLHPSIEATRTHAIVSRQAARNEMVLFNWIVFMNWFWYGVLNDDGTRYDAMRHGTPCDGLIICSGCVFYFTRSCNRNVLHWNRMWQSCVYNMVSVELLCVVCCCKTRSKIIYQRKNWSSLCWHHCMRMKCLDRDIH